MKLKLIYHRAYRLFGSLVLFFVISSQCYADIKRNQSVKENNDRLSSQISFQPGPLEELNVPSEWPFDKNSLFMKRHKSLSIENNGITNRTKTDCVFLLSNWEKNSEEHRQKRGGDGCIQKLGWWYYNTGDTEPIRDVILSWAINRKPTFDIYRDDFNPDQYDAIALIALFSSFYAVKYDEFELTRNERAAVDEFVLREMLDIPIDTVGESKNQIFCNPNKHELIGKRGSPRPDINTCGSNRWKVTISQLLVSLRFSNQELFEKGVYNTRFKLALFDEEGIYVTWATRGALAWEYSHDVTTMLSLLTEIYNSVGYNFLQHELDNGLFVHELFEKQFKIVDDVSILEKYAARQYAVKGTNYEAWKKLSNEEKVKNWPKSSLAYSAQTYMNERDKSLFNLIDCDISVFSPSVVAITNFNIVDIWELHYKRQQNGFCESLTLSWFTELKSDNYERVLEARDTVPMRNGAILKKSISYENITFDSQNHGRENLNIGLDNETISISGEIQVFEGEFVTINLEASLSSGEARFALNDIDWFVVSWN